MDFLYHLFGDVLFQLVSGNLWSNQNGRTNAMDSMQPFVLFVLVVGAMVLAFYWLR